MSEQPCCDCCEKPAIWKIKVMTRTFVRCKEHQYLTSMEFAWAVFHKGKWVVIEEDVMRPENTEMGIDDLKRRKLKEHGIPVGDYL